MRRLLTVSFSLLVIVGCESAQRPPETSSAAAAPTPSPAPPPAEKSVAPASTPPAPPAQAIPAKAYEVPPLELGPQAEGLVLDVGKPTTAPASKIVATLAPPNRGQKDITEWRVKLVKGGESLEIHFETAELYFEGTAFGNLVVLRDKKENPDQAVLTIKPGAPQPLTEEEAVKLAEAEVTKRGLPKGSNVSKRNDAGVVMVTFADAHGEGTQVLVGRFTRSVRNIRPIVGVKRGG